MDDEEPPPDEVLDAFVELPPAPSSSTSRGSTEHAMTMDPNTANQTRIVQAYHDSDVSPQTSEQESDAGLHIGDHHEMTVKLQRQRGCGTAVAVAAAMTRYSLPFLALLAVGCGADGSSPSSNIGPPPSGGAFGQANVQPECGAFSQACLESGMDAPLAVGAAMGLGIDYNIAGNSGPSMTLLPADATVLSAEGAVIFGEAAGSSALMILGPEQEVIDFIHVWVTTASELRLVRHNDAGAAIGTVASEGTLLVGDEILLSVESFSSTQALMGLFETTFEIDVVEGDAPIAIVEDIVFGWYRLVARGEGRARIRASALDQTRELELEVLP